MSPVDTDDFYDHLDSIRASGRAELSYYHDAQRGFSVWGVLEVMANQKFQALKLSVGLGQSVQYSARHSREICV